jgi:hypothetical protein
MKVADTHYLLRLYHGGVNANYPRPLVIETFEDASKWNEIDHRKNDEGLNGTCQSEVVEAHSVSEFRFVRI